MSFSILNSAYSGMQAARAGIEVTGQNINNVATAGYTRQRVDTSATAGLREMGMARLHGATTPGQGVNVDGITRMGNVFLENRAHHTASVSGYSTTRAEAFTAIEDIHGEPAEHGVASKLQAFWSAWQGVANAPGEPAQGHILLQEAQALATSLSSGRAQIAERWDQARFTAESQVSQLNTAAAQVADLNHEIQLATSQGRSVNELIDQRSMLTTQLANLAGATIQQAPGGVVNVLVGGNFLVEGKSHNAVSLAGASTMDAQDGPAGSVRLEWAGPTGGRVDLGGGELAGHISALAPAAAGGIYASAAAGYDELATQLATDVNAIYSTGQNAAGDTGAPFFELAAGVPPASGLSVAVTDPAAIAAANPTQGSLDGSVADAISQLGNATDGPDATWRNFVSRTAVSSQSASQEALLAQVADHSATSQLLGSSSVSMDEETVNLLQYQHAYQGAARVLTAVDELLDHLINRTGIVGR